MVRGSLGRPKVRRGRVSAARSAPSRPRRKVRRGVLDTDRRRWPRPAGTPLGRTWDGKYRGRLLKNTGVFPNIHILVGNNVLLGIIEQKYRVSWCVYHPREGRKDRHGGVRCFRHGVDVVGKLDHASPLLGGARKGVQVDLWPGFEVWWAELSFRRYQSVLNASKTAI